MNENLHNLDKRTTLLEAHWAQVEKRLGRIEDKLDVLVESSASQKAKLGGLSALVAAVTTALVELLRK